MDAWLGMSRDEPNEVTGSGVCVAREGRERRRTLRDRECGLVDWEWDWAMVAIAALSIADVRVSFFLVY